MNHLSYYIILYQNTLCNIVYVIYLLSIAKEVNLNEGETPLPSCVLLHF